MKVTVQTVAAQAEVSVGTVSRVINDDPSVSPALSARVRQSIEELGYRPLRKKRLLQEDRPELKGKTIGLMTLGMDRSLSRLPVVTAAIDGIREAAGAAEANLQMVDVPSPDVASESLRKSQFDGWLIKSAMQGDIWEACHPDLKAQFQSRPCICFHGRPQGMPGWSIGVNDWEVGAMAARTLRDHGHQRVAFLSPKQNHLLLKQRQLGFASTCEELGLQCTVLAKNLQEWTFPLERPRSLDAVKQLLAELLRNDPSPTAIFVPADSIAVLLYRALAEEGLRIPEDISVISANREEGLIASLFPSLTTIDIRAEEIGREAVGLLERLFASDARASEQDLRIAPTLVEGESLKTL